MLMLTALPAVADAGTLTATGYSDEVGVKDNVNVTAFDSLSGFVLLGSESFGSPLTAGPGCSTAPEGAWCPVRCSTTPNTCTQQTLSYPGQLSVDLGGGDDVGVADSQFYESQPEGSPACTTSVACPIDLIFQGGSGNDELHLFRGYNFRSVTVLGGPGDDMIRDDNDLIAAPPLGVSGSVAVDGGPGNDSIYADAHIKESIVCGEGNDSVHGAGPEDSVAVDCESGSSTVPTAEPPVARCDAYWVKEGGQLSVPAPGVLGNDFDPNGLSIAPKVDRISFGVADHPYSLAASGALKFTPNSTPKHKPSVAEIVYHVVSAAGASQPTTIKIYIQPTKPAADKLQGCGDAEFKGSGTDGKLKDLCPRKVGKDILGGCDSLKELSGGEIAALYAPYMHFHTKEVFWPLSIDTFIDRSILQWRHDSKCPDKKYGHVTAAQLSSSQGLVGRDAGLTRKGFEVHRCGAQGPRFGSNDFTRPYSNTYSRHGLPDGEGFFLNLPDSLRHGERPDSGKEYDPSVPVYYLIDSKRRWIRYYVMSGWSAFITGRTKESCCHEGEWEGVSLKLSDSNGPTEVCMNEHHDGYRHGWAGGAISKYAITHPEVWVAYGTHASYPEAGKFKVIKGFDDLTDNGRIWKTWESPPPLNVKSQAWYGYGGAWGHGSPLSAAPVKNGDTIGPTGPPWDLPVPSDWPGAPKGETTFAC
ncbi:MAG TPA: hypothetical protein VF085_11315 [Solirubrobacterales bacterium]